MTKRAAKTRTGAVPRPSKLLALTEVPRALFELSALAWSAPWLLAGPRGDGHPVLVLPGFVASDTSTAILRRYLTAKGYDAHSWNLGRNLGPKAIGREGQKLMARLEEVYAQTGEKVSLVGWSLGGIMARLIANRRPDLVRQVITLGSPFGGDLKASNVWRAYEMLSGDRIESPQTQRLHAQSAVAPPVPTTAIYSKGDGIVAWQNCREGDHATTDNIEVYGSHIGLVVNPSVLAAIGNRLARPDGSLTPFERRGIGRVVYPSSGHAH